MPISETDLAIEDALTLKRAEIWLEVDRPGLALDELEGLGGRSRAHPWTARLLDAIRSAVPCSSTRCTQTTVPLSTP